MLTKYLLVSLTGFLAGMIVVVLLKKFSLRHKILVKTGIPIIGGVAIGIAFFLASFLGLAPLASLHTPAAGIIVASFAILIFGIIDDFLELSISAKFLMQIISIAILIFFGVKTNIVGIGNIGNILVTFIWMLGITNSFNHLDVIDGVAGVVAITVGFAFFAVSLLNADFVSAVLSLSLASVTFSFLVFNIPPAKVYMGNAGSHFLGFVLGAIALTISYAGLDNKVALLTPIVILGFPIIDTTMLVFLRISRKIFPFKKSNDHPALRFLAMGYSKRKALLVMFLWSLFFSFCGVAMSWVNNTLGAFIILISVLAGLILFKIIRNAEVHG